MLLLAKRTNPQNKEGTESIGMVVARNLARPQALFAEKVDNGYTTPFVSLVYQLGQKPNAMKPLSEGTLYAHD